MKVSYELKQGYIDIWNEESGEWDRYIKVNKKSVVEEEKKIPEKLPYYSLEKIQKAKNKDEWREERISLLEKRIDDYHNKINEIINYIEPKYTGSTYTIKRDESDE